MCTGKNLASLVIGAGAVFGALDSKSAEWADIYSHTNIVADANTTGSTKDKAVYYNCTNVLFNGRIPREKIVLVYMKYHQGLDDKTNLITTLVPAGGLTIEPNTGVAQGYLNSTNAISKYESQRTLMFPGEVATNGLNGFSFWVAGQDFGGDLKVGQWNSSYGINWQSGEMVSNKNMYAESPDNEIQFTGMPAFPTNGVGPVTIDSIRINGYPDFNNTGYAVDSTCHNL
jgi:hypothetical protein